MYLLRLQNLFQCNRGWSKNDCGWIRVGFSAGEQGKKEERSGS